MEITRHQRLGAFIRSRRKKMGLTQVALLDRLKAHSFDYSEAALASWESGQGVVPLNAEKNNTLFLDALAASLEVNPIQILETVGMVKPEQMSVDPDAVEITHLLANATPQQRSLAKQLIATVVSAA